MEYGACGYEVVGCGFDYVLEDVELAYFQVGCEEIVDVAGVVVGGGDVSFAADFGGEPLGDGAVAAADFEASPTGTQADSFEEGLVHGIEEIGHEGEALALAGETMRQDVAGLRSFFWQGVPHLLFGVSVAFGLRPERQVQAWLMTCCCKGAFSGRWLI